MNLRGISNVGTWCECRGLHLDHESTSCTSITVKELLSTNCPTYVGSTHLDTTLQGGLSEGIFSWSGELFLMILVLVIYQTEWSENGSFIMLLGGGSSFNFVTYFYCGGFGAICSSLAGSNKTNRTVMSEMPSRVHCWPGLCFVRLRQFEKSVFCMYRRQLRLAVESNTPVDGNHN